MKPYVGVWTSRGDMLQMCYEKALEYYAECGITSIVVGYEGVNSRYYEKLRYPEPSREETYPTLRETCRLARDVGLDVEVVMGTYGPSIAEHPETAIVDVFGNRSPSRPCPSNPDVLARTLARIREILESNDAVTGLEYDGLYLDMHARMTNPRQPGAFYPLHHVAPESCFCPHCRRIAREEDADIDRIERTVREVTKLSLEPSSPVFYRLFDTFRGQYDMVRYLLRRPELLEWLDLRCRIVERAFKTVHETIKSVNRRFVNSQDMLPPTWSWSLAQDYGRHRAYCDNYKVIFFNKRTGSYEVNPLIGIGDKVPEVPDEELMALFKSLTGYEGPLSFAAFSQQGFPPRNVYYELRKAREEVGPGFTLIAGIVGDAPATPEEVEATVTMAAKGGANGFCLHTWYGRTTPSNYAAFGNKARELVKLI